MYCEHYSTLPYLCKAIDGTTQLRKNQNRPEMPSYEPAAEYLRTACGIIAAEPLNSKSNYRVLTTPQPPNIKSHASV